MELKRIFYEENHQTFVATGKILSEDEWSITVEDRFDGEIRIGKKYIIKIKDVTDDGNSPRR